MSGFLSRWTQRREEVAKEAEQSELAASLPESVADNKKDLSNSDNANVIHDALPEAEPKVLTAEDLPDPESIEIGGSFASFMGANVDPAAKTAALRALWKQPQYNHIDGLLEYALDYSNQPKLSAEVSAELAKKVFKHVIEKQEKSDELVDEASSEEIDEASQSALAEQSDELQSADEVGSGDIDATNKVEVDKTLTEMSELHDEQSPHVVTPNSVPVS